MYCQFIDTDLTVDHAKYEEVSKLVWAKCLRQQKPFSVQFLGGGILKICYMVPILCICLLRGWCAVGSCCKAWSGLQQSCHSRLVLGWVGIWQFVRFEMALWDSIISIIKMHLVLRYKLKVMKERLSSKLLNLWRPKWLSQFLSAKWGRMLKVDLISIFWYNILNNLCFRFYQAYYCDVLAEKHHSR